MRVDKTKWVTKSISSFFDLQMGKTPPRKSLELWNNGIIPWVSIADMNDKKYISATKEMLSTATIQQCNIPIVPIGTVIMSFKLTIGKTCITKVPLTTNEAIMAFYPKSNTEINNLFLCYALSAHKWKGNRAVKGVTINKKTISQEEISLPSISVQQSIASELDAIQAMIDGYRQQIADLDTLAQSIFLDTFGDVASNEKGWNVIRMGKLGEFKNGLNYSKGERGKLLKIIGVGDFKNIKSITSFSEIPSIEVETVSEEYLLHNEDIVFVRSNGNKNLVGRCLEVYPNNAEVVFSGFCIRFRKTVDIENKYLVALLTEEGFKKAHLLKSNGIGIQNINQKLLNSLPIPVPPIELQHHFATQVESIEKQKELLRQQLADAETLMAERMQYYFS